jgi:hypothetical protein
MNWEAITAIGQALGAIGVIASLLYLTTQVRQNNRASAVAAKLASTQLLSDFVDSLIADPELMQLWLSGRNDFDSLNDGEHSRFVNVCLKAFWFFSAARFQLQAGTLSEEDWTEFHTVIVFWLGGKGIQTWWRKMGSTYFGKDFVLFINREIAALDLTAQHVAATDVASRRG